MSQYTDLINHYIGTLSQYGIAVSINLASKSGTGGLLDTVDILRDGKTIYVPVRECDYALIMSTGDVLFLTNISVKFPGISFKSDSNSLWFAVPEIADGNLSVTALCDSGSTSLLNRWYRSMFNKRGCLDERSSRVHLCLCTVRKLPQFYDNTISSLVKFEREEEILELEKWFGEDINKEDLEVIETFQKVIEKYNSDVYAYSSSLRKNPLSKRKNYLGILRIIGIFMDCKCGVPEIKIDYSSTNLQRESATISFSRYVHDSFELKKEYGK